MPARTHASVGTDHLLRVRRRGREVTFQAAIMIRALVRRPSTYSGGHPLRGAPGDLWDHLETAGSERP